jgi:hypothetical protein
MMVVGSRGYEICIWDTVDRLRPVLLMIRNRLALTIIRFLNAHVYVSLGSGYYIMSC